MHFRNKIFLDIGVRDGSAKVRYFVMFADCFK